MRRETINGILGLASAVAITMPMPVVASTEVEILRCEARSKQAGARFLRCIASCDDRAALSETQGVEESRCEDRCVTRYANALANPGCAGAASEPLAVSHLQGQTPATLRCLSKLHTLEARLLNCQANCAAAADLAATRNWFFDHAACDATCQVRYEDAVDSAAVQALCTPSESGGSDETAIEE